MMDGNNIGGGPFDGVPLGFGMALAMNEKALDGYAKMTEAEKEEQAGLCRNGASLLLCNRKRDYLLKCSEILKKRYDCIESDSMVEFTEYLTKKGKVD